MCDFPDHPFDRPIYPCNPDQIFIAKDLRINILIWNRKGNWGSPATIFRVSTNYSIPEPSPSENTCS